MVQGRGKPDDAAGKALAMKESEDKSMKQIIEGKSYNTEIASKLASARNPSAPYSNDFHYWSESLYRTKSGTYFLAGEGGPMSSWAEKTGQNEWSGGSGIRTKTEAEAREWVESWANDQYEAIFGPALEA